VPSQEVFLFPPEETPTREHLLGRVRSSDGQFDGFARSDGTFTYAGSALTDQAHFAIVFRTAQEAIAWAEAAPRRWQVANKYMFGPNRVRMPRRMTVSVISATNTPWYAHHNNTQRRREAGEELLEVDIKFRPLDPVVPLGGCRVYITRADQAILGRAGILRPVDIVGHILVLESDDPDDLLRPLRIVQVR